MPSTPLPDEVERWMTATTAAGAIIIALLAERDRLYLALADANGHRKETTADVAA